MELPTCIQGFISRFCEEAHALHSYELSAEDRPNLLTEPRVFELGPALHSILHFMVGSPEPELIAAAFLSDFAFMAALLRTFAWTTWGTHERRDYSSHADPALINLQLDVGDIMAQLIVLGRGSAASERATFSLVKSLVRMQTPQCLSRRLFYCASAAEELRAMWTHSAGAAAGSKEGQGALRPQGWCSSASWMVGLLTSFAIYAAHLRGSVDQAASEASSSTSGPTTDGAPTSLGRRRRRAGAAGLAQQQSEQLQEERHRAAVLAERKGCLQELEAALSESGAVEHAARAVLLLAEVASSATGGAARAGTSWANIDVALANWAEFVRAWSTLHGPSLTASAGPCAQHLAIACGLAALCEADGGAAYGMPRAALSVLGAAGRASARIEFPLDGRTLMASCARDRVIDPFLHTLTGGLDLASPPMPLQPLPLKRGAIRTLLLRFGHWAVASAREWARLEREGPGGSITESAAVASGAIAAPEPASAPLARAASSASTGALPPPVGAGAIAGPAEAANRQTGQQTGQPVRRPPLLLGLDVCCSYALHALRSSQAAQAVEVEWWRLAVDVALHAMRGSSNSLQTAIADAIRLDPSVLGDEEGVLPPAPPPPVAAALGGGLLGCTEALMRRAGRDPGGREAGILTHLLCGTEAGEAAWAQFAPLLAYGEPRGAASLIATMRKVLRRAMPPLVVTCAQRSHSLAAHDAACDFLQAMVRLACFVLVDRRFWFAAAAAADRPSGAATAVAAAQGAAMPGSAPPLQGQAPTAQRQLWSMLSYALCAWLPVLSRHSAMAYVQPNPAHSDGDASFSILGAALLPHLRWLPILARGVATAPPAPSPQPTLSSHDGAAAAAAASAEPQHVGPKEGGNAQAASADRYEAAAGAAELATSEACGGWRGFLLEEVGAVPLIGLLLSMGTKMASGSPLSAFVEQLADSAVALAAACPQEVRRAAVAAAACGELPVIGKAWLLARGGEAPGSGQEGRSRRPPRRGRGAGVAAGRAAQDGLKEGATSTAVLYNVLCLAGGPVGEVSRPLWYPSVAQWLALQQAGDDVGGGCACGNLPSVEVPVWPAAAVRSLAAVPEARGAAASRLSALASQLERWAAGQDAGGEPGGSAGGAGDGGGGSSSSSGGGGGTDDDSLDALLRALTPPAEARRLLRTCAYPGCVNLEGDSEADLPLQACSRCGEAWYCGRDCQLAHWRAGHRAACEWSRQASALQRIAN